MRQFGVAREIKNTAIILICFEDGQNCKMVIKIEFTPLLLSDYKIFPFKRVLKNSKFSKVW